MAHGLNAMRNGRKKKAKQQKKLGKPRTRKVCKALLVKFAPHEMDDSFVCKCGGEKCTPSVCEIAEEVNQAWYEYELERREKPHWPRYSSCDEQLLDLEDSFDSTIDDLYTWGDTY